MGCQKGKIHKHIQLQPDAIPIPQRRFAYIHVDLVIDFVVFGSGPRPFAAFTA
jgi:hypothetical protein